MPDDVLSVRYSPNGKLLAVSLLDSTVKVFYQDALKFFLTLYGHKVCAIVPFVRLVSDGIQLPVLSMDISDDSKLIVTCSADKNVKVWGLDFGDCHKSIFAHDESIMQVAFEKKSHYFWTVGRDKLLKYWDGDKVRFNGQTFTACLIQAS
jgi:U3 small nucleolar RNA-associated protein 12